ncbi:MAG: ribosome biogenesis GTPase YlqF [Lachnospiraceae bacterium]|nr:ribosome biogenesis GTPase YlqF [Lachnospiraceae bacterium]
MEYQWYPGHMTKARRMMEENIRLVDLVIELVDARIPFSSRNPDIDALCKGKGRVLLLCKADLADPIRTGNFQDYFRDKGILAVAVDARERKTGEVVRRFIQEAGREKTARDRARGIVGRPLRAMVAGIPNVGKSTFINSFAGRASTKTDNKPGVTRGKQWIRMDGGVELLDTPGILWPKFEDQEIGMRLALAGAIRDEILDREELALWLLAYLQREYPGLVEAKYLEGADQAEQMALPGDSLLPADYLLLQRIALARRLLMKGGEPDAGRAAAMLLDDCRNGRIGRISLEDPGMAAEFEKRMSETARREDRDPGTSGRAVKKSAGPAGGQKGRASGRPQGRRDRAEGRPSSGDRPGGRSGSGSRGGRPSGREGRRKK